MSVRKPRTKEQEGQEMTDNVQLPKTLTAAMQDALDVNKFSVEVLGLIVELGEPTRAVVRMPSKEELTQQFGNVHGCPIAGLADVAGCLAAFSLFGLSTVTGSLTVNYLAPAPGSQPLVADARQSLAFGSRCFTSVVVHTQSADGALSPVAFVTLFVAKAR
jgi:uncharacterized protein (TIGR00369 family)